MKQRPTKSKMVGSLAKKNDDYRGWRRNNAITWKGVEPDRVAYHPPLVPKVSQRGEKHYVELWM